MKVLFGRKLNNRGSALLIVVLTVGFLTILATTLLYISGMNSQIKQADYQNKKNFYTGETGLEQIRANLMKDTSEAASKAYNNVSQGFVTLGSKDARQLEFYNEFVDQLQEIWDAKLATEGNNWQNLLEDYFTPDPGYTLELDSTYDSNGNVVWESSEVLDIHAAEGYIRIRGLKMKYIDPKTKRATIISTDLDVFAPELDWSAEGSRNTLETGVTAEEAAKRKKVDVSKCVRYANWKKE